MKIKSLFGNFLPGAIMIAPFYIVTDYAMAVQPVYCAAGDSSLFMNESWCIFPINDKEICDVRLVSIHKGSVRYEQGGEIKTLASPDFSRLEGKNTVFWFDSAGTPMYSPYDRLTGNGGDSLLGLIREVKGTYINCYLKGKAKAGFLPANAVKDYTWNSRDHAMHAQITAVPATVPPVQEDKHVEQPPPDTVRTGSPPVQQTPVVESPPVSNDIQKDDECYKSYLQGENAARESSSVIWGGAGAVTACCGCPWAIPIIGLNLKYNPPSYPPGVNESCYRIGYANRAKHNGIMAASIGSAVVTISIGIVYYFMLISSNTGI